MASPKTFASQFAAPVAIDNNTVELLERVEFSETSSEFNEARLRDLLFEHPQCLPVDEIDRAFIPLVPICRELFTLAGRIDALYATPHGRIVVLEAKLWKNPEARRKVIGQILDYAKELKRWKYSDLQREVSKVTGQTGNVIYDLVASACPAERLSESEFVDAVSRNLRAGRFLLMIAADGIREDTHAIVEFLMGTGTMLFTLAMVEIAIYRRKTGDGIFVQPRVLAKTAIIDRIVVDNSVSVTGQREPDDLESGDNVSAQILGFWQAFLTDLRLDDPDQVIPSAARTRHLWFAFPWSGELWLTVYFASRDKEIGVMLRLRGSIGGEVYSSLLLNKEQIEKDFGSPLKWSIRDDGQFSVSAHIDNIDALSASDTAKAISYLQDTVNRFINVFRPRLSELLQQSKTS